MVVVEKEQLYSAHSDCSGGGGVSDNVSNDTSVSCQCLINVVIFEFAL